MRQRLTKREVQAIERMSDRIYKMYSKVRDEKDDVPLNYGNGTVWQQLSCAMAALDCILQEYE